MSLNNYFNIKRFGLLLQQDLLINRTKYLLGILGLGLITYLLCYLFLTLSKHNFTVNIGNVISYYIIFFGFYMMVVGVVVGTAFPDLTDKIKTANYLLSPASTFEKFLVQFVLRIGLFIPIALGIFWIVLRLAKDSLAPELLYENQFFDPTKLPDFEFNLLLIGMKLWQKLAVIFGFFSYGAYLFAGTTYFKRYALIKAVIFSGVLVGISILFSMFLSNIFYPQTKFFAISLQEFNVTEELISSQFSLLFLTLVSWIFFLFIAYFKLKEKEA